jgi:formylglycine-generating enzyme required for sulfatase activity
MAEVFMAKKFWVICATFILSVTRAYAVETDTTVRVSPAQLFKDTTTGMEFVFIKGSCYQMGDIFDDPEGGAEEKPVHEVCVDDFYLGKYEVTQGQWKSVMESNPSNESFCGDNCPVGNVSWNDAQDFIGRLNSRSGGSKYRLPTEAEWEYAARSGGKSERYSGGNDVDSVAWYNENSDNKLHLVGTKAPNGFGIYDMAGSVWEWTNDWYGSNYYSSSPRNNPAGPDSGVDRVVRGGCVTGEAYNMRTVRRNGYTPDTRRPSLGFRLLRTL